MPAPRTEYKRLRGLPNDFLLAGEAHSMWLGDDHLLYVMREGYTETYRRFYFRDIRTLIIHRTSRHRLLALLCGIPFLVFGSLLLGAVLGRWGLGAGISFSLLTLFFVIPFLLTLFRGPTCVCRIRTAVQEQTLYPLSRVRHAVPSLAELRERIEAVQGVLPDGEFTIPVPEPAVAVPPPPPPAPPVLMPSGPRYCKGTAHLMLFALLVADCFATVIAFVTRDDGVPEIGRWALFAALLGCSIAALAAQERSTMWPQIRRLAWVSLAYVLAQVVVSFGFLIAAPTLHVAEHGRNAQPTLLYPSTTTVAGAIWGMVALFATGVIGTLGLVRTMEYRRCTGEPKVRPKPPAPSMPLPPPPPPPPIPPTPQPGEGAP